MRRYEIPLSTAVGLTKTKPLIFVYWGSHIKSKEEARMKLPDGWLGDYLTEFFPADKPAGGGWLGMRRFEDSPIQFECAPRPCAAPATLQPLQPCSPCSHAALQTCRPAALQTCNWPVALPLLPPPGPGTSIARSPRSSRRCRACISSRRSQAW